MEECGGVSGRSRRERDSSSSWDSFAAVDLEKGSRGSSILCRWMAGSYDGFFGEGETEGGMGIYRGEKKEGEGLKIQSGFKGMFE